MTSPSSSPFTLRRDAPAIAILISMALASAWAWTRVPDRLPIHWGIDGAPDGWGGRAAGLLLLPATALGLWVLFLLLPRFDPRRANYAGFAGPYALLRTGILAFLALLHGVAIAAALGAPVNMGSVAANGIGLLFMLLGGVMGRIRPNWFVGIRTPWTLTSERAWSRTHRVGGWAFGVLGVGVVLGGRVSPRAGYTVMIGGIVAITAFSFVYSYLVWRGDPDRLTPDRP